LRTLQASNIEKATSDVQKEIRGITGQTGAGLAEEAETLAAPKREYSDAEKTACSIEAMMNGETCEACQ
jgi:ribonucleoside-diphosphate reductase alpha chain